MARKSFKQVEVRWQKFCRTHPELPTHLFQLSEGNLGGCALHMVNPDGGTTTIQTADTFSAMYVWLDMGFAYDPIIKALRRHFGMGVNVDVSRISRAIGDLCLWTGVWTQGDLKLNQSQRVKIVAIGLETKNKWTSPVERTQVVRVVYDVLALELDNVVISDVPAEALWTEEEENGRA